MVKGLPRSIRRNEEVLFTGEPVLNNWGDFQDTQYNEQNPFITRGDKIWEPLPNNALGGIGAALEDDPLYVDGKITGENGRGIILSLRMNYKRYHRGARLLSVGIYIGGVFVNPILQNDWPLYLSDTMRMSHTFSGYTLGTWVANGGQVMVASNRPVSLWDIGYVINRG